MADDAKEPHTAIFNSPTGCGKSYLILDLIRKSITSILITPSLSAQRFVGIRHIVIKDGQE